MSNVIFSQKLYDTAQLIVDGCMGDADPACQTACPMHTDVKQYVRLAGEGNYQEALDLIRGKLFLPQTLGRICAHPCEAACRRNAEFNQPISVAGIKRFVAEKMDKQSNWDLTVANDSGKKIAIVGAGPAGAQAAIELRRSGHQVTIYEKLNVYGGMMRVGIPEYRLPRDVIDFEYGYLDMLGIETKFGVEIGKDISFNELRLSHDAIVLAHGAHVGSIIPLPGHKAQGVFSAVEYLKEVSETRDFPRAGKRIMVIGGGDVAMDCARSSWRIGADEVHQCSLEEMTKLPASQIEIDESLEEGVLFNAGWGPISIEETDGKVTGIVLKKVISIFDENGNFAPSYSDESRTIAVDTVIFATGQVVADITDGALEQTRGGRYVVDKQTLASSVDGVYVAGDACGGNIVVEAMALGHKAALSIERQFAKRPLTEDRNFEQEYNYTSRLDVPLPKGTTDIPRLHGQLRDIEERKQDFKQVDLGFSEEQIKQEASRCLQCSCKLCMNECVMMNDFGDCPKTLFSDFIDNKTMDPLLAYSCNACDQCTIVCPKDYPMKEMFLSARVDFVNANGGNSPIPGHKAINMHQKLGFSKFFTMAKRTVGSK
ncbi:FAD-dependent oxidoreductase [Aliivibrio sp. S4TY2]|uniref:FAD-dependent oxidoreductase n=1 Tax=unclassified Aliivibrio TaxID=2645654 RepID=UPI0023786E3C|nr:MULTISPECIES: FAD-dependent oxidoreductase [unclassified Aliivibrio]MDD9155293.1 FAD-dependent oxidoreductase [Aliivibrio sp. S4TY2]MDD9159155.1 FAD-dependent oxidoreductase [Aliivibrio sp. S4TY1]MDD9163295.1 FAD-dependent oxidoreductase [Aliivibrio sp. S4MY2]MDD9167154.1 FAD-dependent oxidoreductase [Aliivibrio sp. S4MY4]MDD9184372.1 FAD-dependent oxidoreductase [Aliivibrio sp. S4MY3]